MVNNIRARNWILVSFYIEALLFRYIRLSDTTPMSKVKELLIDHWGLFRPHRPHLALSLIGGAKNFRMEGLFLSHTRVRKLSFFANSAIWVQKIKL
jgi:hypothetical protein